MKNKFYTLAPQKQFELRQLAYKAADIAMQFYDGERNFDVTTKKDNSPVTEADLAVSSLLEQSLPSIANFPVLSEENKPNSALWKEWSTYWLVDPIDGTKHFINGSGDFCICIALINNHRATLGLILSPVTRELWIGQHHPNELSVIEKYLNNEKTSLPKNASDEMSVTLSSDKLSERMEKLLSVFPQRNIYQKGSALKYIDVAQGTATIYPKMWDTCEWDSAAGQCLLECAGGKVIRLDNSEPLTYGKSESLLNPHFIAYKDLKHDYVQALLKTYDEIYAT